MICVIITDDHPVVRAGLRALIDSQPDMAVLADFDTAEDLLAHLRRPAGEADAPGRPDLVLLDLRRPARGGSPAWTPPPRSSPMAARRC